VIVWSTKPLREVRIIQIPGTLSALAFNTKENLIATASPDGSISIWPLETGSPAKTFRSLTGGTSLAFRNDGTLVVSGGMGGIEVLDPKTGAEVDNTRYLPGINFPPGNIILTQEYRMSNEDSMMSPNEDLRISYVNPETGAQVGLDTRLRHQRSAIFPKAGLVASRPGRLFNFDEILLPPGSNKITLWEEYGKKKMATWDAYRDKAV
jgi:hypothetical protein